MHFATTSLRIGAGFLIWALHFAALYVFVALVCARGYEDAQWFGMSMPRFVIAALTLVAIAAQLGVLWQSLRGRWHTEAQRDGHPFVAWLSAAIAAYGLLAVLWSALPGFWVAACPL